METLTDKQARWDRLRADPDFTPEWLKAMGARPSEAQHREWGDGVGKRKAHRVDEVSFENDSLVCSCGWRGTALGGVDWEAHAKPSSTAKAYAAVTLELATDEEVESFLALHLFGERAPAEPASMSNVYQATDAEEHRYCQHGKGGYCYIGYAALHTVIFDPQFPFDRYYPEGEFA